ncbi:MAG: DUF6175 family protein [Prevotella sp.]|jgi:hypothetical protein|nr:DUF6175 family protein [Prevotella sp.]
MGKNVSAQSDNATVTVTQPKIMVIPYTKEGEDIRTILEDDVNKRIALTKIKEAFDNRGFTTVDFTAKLKAMKGNAAFEGENKTDLKSQIVQTSGADVYVEAEIDALFSASGNAIKIILTSYEVSTGNSLSNKVGESGRFYTDDTGKLASKAIESCVEDFLNTMQTKFTDIVANGKSIFVNIGFDEGSEHNMSSEVGTQGLLLSDELELWMENNAFKNNYHIQGTTDNQMIFDDVRIPLKDPETGNNYNPNKFGLSLWKFLRSLNLEVKRNIKGNTLYITIQ